MKVLHLTLKKKYFDMIASGEKREEYREIKPYWSKRLHNNYDVVTFKNGYAKNAPTITVKFMPPIMSGLGIVEWGAPEKQRVYVIKLGRIIDAMKTER